MQLIKCVTAITISSLSIFSIPVIAQTNKERWVDLGKTNSGEILKLNDSSIGFQMMLADDSLNNEDGFYNDNDKFPKTKVIVFDYSISGRKRSGYTKSCKQGNLAANPTWKTYTSLIDYWPQYFLVEADSVASKKMLQRVCSLSLYKQ
ncbi:MAG: hypothetical protein HEQ29_00585 [Dolichospermum sp. LBC05a]|jgi:hypothetical protein|uniref:hypothetical protein n=1 Tax=Dolichospermum lemmermannii TaxID=54295 RepID=UPI001AF78AB4|nr:hypothetical protein [Dolichospermum lemmermannii]MBS9391707.1 hypothetical protein [Dolichospermum sp. OL01]MCO5795357.1 hypothetical protein [Dolichospermum sp. OL03]MCS6281380.1 hypothetical protein [Dolichospermum sp.]QSV57077.1 MAG: hypothetical protein HEQ29_00585 [Dolichospermum sp. LBC05a]MDB9435907.1 hypothetical protein [Dolichospermum lemmermannii CS-548]